MTITRPGDVAAAGSLHERVLAVAAAMPHADALVTTTGRVSYGRLAEQVRAVAAALSVAGIAPGDTVAVVGTACAEQIPAVLGVMAAGATDLPVPAGSAPEEALSAMRRGAARMALVCGDVSPAWLPALTVREALRVGALEPGFRVVTPEPWHTAAILPTATLSHAALLAAVDGPSAETRTVTPALAGEDSLREVFGALLAGAPVLIADRAEVGVVIDHPLTFLPPVDTAIAS